MKPYELYLKLEEIRQKISKIDESNRDIANAPLSKIWRQLPFMDPESDETLRKHELVLEYTNLFALEME